jgi:hypothetical protein
VYDPAFLELLDTFAAHCLKEFPDDAAVAAKAAAAGYRELDEAQLRSFLHGDPGRGWALARPHNRYVLSIESPPHHYCVVRAMFPKAPDGPNIALPMSLLFGAWGANQKPPENMVARTPMHVQMGDRTQTVYPFEMTGPDKHSIETIAAFVALVPNSETVEIRFARMREGTSR